MLCVCYLTGSLVHTGTSRDLCSISLCVLHGQPLVNKSGLVRKSSKARVRDLGGRSADPSNWPPFPEDSKPGCHSTLAPVMFVTSKDRCHFPLYACSTSIGNKLVCISLCEKSGVVQKDRVATWLKSSAALYIADSAGIVPNEHHPTAL